MTDAERALAEEALSIVPVVINAMNRSFPGISKKLAKIDARSVAYVAVCRAAQTYDPEKSQVTTYFSAAVRNSLLKELAKSQRLRYDSPERVPLEIAEKIVGRHGSRESKLPAAMSALHDDARSLITSRYIGGLSIKEMSVRYGCNQKKIRARLKLAVEQLSQLLGTDAERR